MNVLSTIQILNSRTQILVNQSLFLAVAVEVCTLSKHYLTNVGFNQTPTAKVSSKIQDAFIHGLALTEHARYES